MKIKDTILGAGIHLHIFQAGYFNSINEVKT